MISWIVIAVLVVFGIAAIKMNHLRHKTFIIVLILLALFLYSTMYLVHIQNDLDLDSAEGVYHAGQVYFGWLANAFSNLKSITGSAVKMNWNSVNGTFFEVGEK
jgi:hypothetical protein